MQDVEGGVRGAEVVAKDVVSDGGRVQDFIDVVSINGQYRRAGGPMEPWGADL